MMCEGLSCSRHSYHHANNTSSCCPDYHQHSYKANLNQVCCNYLFRFEDWVLGFSLCSEGGVSGKVSIGLGHTNLPILIDGNYSMVSIASCGSSMGVYVRVAWLYVVSFPLSTFQCCSLLMSILHKAELTINFLITIKTDN